MGKAWEIGTITFPIICIFFPLDSHPVVYFIIWEMHVFPPSISHSTVKLNKTYRIEGTMKIDAQ